MPQDFFVRRYLPSDAGQMRWLHDRTPPDGQVAVRPQQWPAALDGIETNFQAFWVAVEPIAGSDALIGMAGLCLPGSPAELVPAPVWVLASAGTLIVDFVRVAPERQRRGIGRLLMETAICWARDNHYEALILNTTPQQRAAVALYTALGFVEAGRSILGAYELLWFRLDL